jgi:ribosomal protein S17
MNKRRRMVGKVTSNKMMKTVVVEVVRKYRHPCTRRSCSPGTAPRHTMS